MPNFKPKTLKKISVDEKKTITLDGKHTEIINKFNKELYEDIPKLKNQIQEKKKKILNISTIDEKIELENEIIELKKKIKQIKKKKKTIY